MVKDPKTGAVSKVIVAKDDVIRCVRRSSERSSFDCCVQTIYFSLLVKISHNTQLSTLLKIRSAFPQWPPAQTTGGNASQNSDGAAAVLLMRRSKAKQLGLKILGKHIATSVVGVPPRIMGIGPAYAVPAVLKLAGIQKDDVDLFEVRQASFFLIFPLHDVRRFNPLCFDHPDK